MAFQLYASVGDTTTQLNDGNPFRLESAEGLSGAPVNRFGQRSPLQNGMTDLGYRLQPRIITLNLVFTATSDAELDDYRDQLIDAFRPSENTGISLSVLRDDDTIRTLTCHTTADIAITLAPELRPGHTHRATVQLRAANPLYRANSVTVGSAIYDEWWLAGGALESSETTGRVEFPDEDFGLAIGGDVNEDWAIAFVTARDTSVISGTPIHGIWGNFFSFTDEFGFWHKETTGDYKLGARIAFVNGAAGTVTLSTTWPGVTTNNLHIIDQRSGTVYWRYWNGSALAVHAQTGTAVYDARLDNIFGWRQSELASGDGAAIAWQEPMPKGIILKSPTTGQLDAIAPYMLGLQGTPTIVNNGDVNAYPIITLQGPIYDPVITNETTGQTIDLTGGTIYEGQTWTVDLRDGNKRIYDQTGSNVLDSVDATPIGMAGFAVAPHPIAAGGTNTLSLTADAIGSAAVFTVQITDEFVSF